MAFDKNLIDKTKEIEDEKKNNETENEKNEKRINVDGLTMLELKDIFYKKRSKSFNRTSYRNTRHNWKFYWRPFTF